MIFGLGKKSDVRTRFAPSPTGPFHVGGLRTALFNYLYAKHNKGTFVLRIEDTDKERSQKEYETEIFKTLSWTGVVPDEGPEQGGEYGPYRQSERTEIYKTHLQRLLDEKKAYYCFATAQKIETFRQANPGKGFIGKRDISREEAEKRIKAGESAVIRFIVEPQTISFHDEVRGEISFETKDFGDIVIAKNLEEPLYNFTVVVDDALMKISHVIRGEDHIPNTPKQILIQKALTLQMPKYAHLPLLLGEDRSKLSKRHGDNSTRELVKAGYLPESMLNFLALLGWNPGDNREYFTKEELVKEFSLEHVQKGGAIFNIQKLNSINAHYIKQTPTQKLVELTKSYVPNITPGIIELYKERLEKLSDIAELADFFFKDTLEYQAELLPWKDATPEQTKEMLEKAVALAQSIREGEPALIDPELVEGESKGWTKEKLENIFMPEAEKEKNRGHLLWPLRVALSGKKASPGPFEIAEILGKEKTLKRLNDALDHITHTTEHKT